MMLHIQRTTDLKDQKAGTGLFCHLCQHERHWVPASHSAMVGDLVLCSCEVEALLCILPGAQRAGGSVAPSNTVPRASVAGILATPLLTAIVHPPPPHVHLGQGGHACGQSLEP